MKIIVTAFFLVFGLAACGGEDESSTTTTSTSETCRTSHICLNDVCECTTSGKSGQSCSDEDACEAQCEVCQ